MFKLLKILNSGVNVPEPVRLPVTASTNFKIGSALTISSGKLANCTATTLPKYIAAQDLTAGEATDMLVYPITDGMIFATKFSVTPTSIVVGNKVTLALESSIAVGVTATTTSGVAEIYNLNGASAAGDTVEVIFR